MKPTLRQFIEYHINDRRELADGGIVYTGYVTELWQTEIPAGFSEVKNENGGLLRLWFSREERALIEFSKGQITIIQTPTMEMFVYEDKHHQNNKRDDLFACDGLHFASLH